jgi:hypothetical protein
MDPKLDPAEVCTLPKDGLNERMAWIRDEILPHARATESLASGLAWELDPAPGLSEKLDRLIALERECCRGIVFERAEASVPGRLRLEVRGIDPAAAVFGTLPVPRERPPARWALLAKAGGLGVLVSLVVCCGVPLLAAALVGGGAAASLAAFDQPWVIALGTLPGAAAAWWWLRGRAALSARVCARARRGGATIPTTTARRAGPGDR